MFKPDEAYGVAGQLEGLSQAVQRGKNAMVAFAEGRLGQPGEPNVTDIVAATNAIAAAGSIVTRLNAEAADPGGAFGTP